MVFDRYVYEAHLPASPPLLTAKRIYFWFLAHAVPRPRATVVLDVPGTVAYGRKQENPPEELEAERRVYRQLTGRVPFDGGDRRERRRRNRAGRDQLDRLARAHPPLARSGGALVNPRLRLLTREIVALHGDVLPGGPAGR